MTFRTYTKLQRLETFEERFKFLSLNGVVGRDTFGHERWMNQQFYKSLEWDRVRRSVIVRDGGCDLGIPGREIHKGLYVHHMIPITTELLDRNSEYLLDPDFLITCSLRTHNAIHYGDDSKLARDPVERRPGDTKLW